jgi:hypothetical protein
LRPTATPQQVFDPGYDGPFPERLICCEEPIFEPWLDVDVVLSGRFFRLPHAMLTAGCALSFVLARSYPLKNEDISLRPPVYPSAPSQVS